MTKKMAGHGGLPLPNLKELGFGWKEARRLIEEQDRIRRRGRELGLEQEGLKAEVKRLKEERIRARADAVRAGTAVEEADALERAEERLAEAVEEAEALRLASSRSHEELLKTVEVNRERWDAEVRKAGEKVLREAQGLADTLSEKLQQAETLGALHEWLESGGTRFAVPVGASVSIEALVRERRRALGIDDLRRGEGVC
jgi:hypothetical protein